MSARLELGATYRSAGTPDSKIPPSTVTIVAIDEHAGVYRTEGKRQAAPVIRFGCEHHWPHRLEAQPAG